MSVLLERVDFPGLATVGPIATAPANAAIDEAALEIGLLNNMPDAALETTEQQFARLLEAAAGDRKVRLHLYSLPTVERSRAARTRIEVVYKDIASLKDARLDGLIVTGAEPKTTELSQEPYWPALAEIVDWARHHTTSAIWSCLAAHAAVLHLDGIRRKRFKHKCSGVFASKPVADDPLLDGLRWPLRIFHSRHHDLAERDLVAAGYRVLTRAPGPGVDIFTKRYESLFVFFQGHPEYDPSSLRGEYLRDVGRYLTGRQDHYPDMPAAYFDGSTESALADLRARALKRRDPAFAAECRAILTNASLTFERRGAATTIFSNWLTYLADQKAAAAHG